MLLELDQEPEANHDEIAAREAQLLPMYTQVAHEFADLHDRSGRMLAKGASETSSHGNQPGSTSYHRLRRRLKLMISAMGAGADLAVVESHSSSVAIQNNVDWNDDAVVTEWLQANIEYVKGEVSSIGRAAAIGRRSRESKVWTPKHFSSYFRSLMQKRRQTAF